MDGENTREWLIPWSSHSMYVCRSNKPRYSTTLTETKGALISYKQVATGSYRKPAESSLHITSLFLKLSFLYYLIPRYAVI